MRGMHASWAALGLQVHVCACMAIQAGRQPGRQPGRSTVSQQKSPVVGIDDGGASAGGGGDGGSAAMPGWGSSDHHCVVLAPALAFI
jgi:hypothetical protein